MNQFQLYISAAFILFLSLMACEKDEVTNLISETPVVTGFIYAGQRCDSIFIVRTISYGSSDTTALPINGLDVEISDGDRTYPLMNEEAGYYYSPDLIIESGAIYTLQFEYNNTLVAATTFVPMKKEAVVSDTLIEMERIVLGSFPPMGGGTPGENAIEITWDNTEGDYYYVVIQNMEEDPDYINSFFEAQDTLQENFRNFQFISEPQVSDYYNIDPNREIRQFGTHRVIVFRVNPEYAALYNVSDVSTLSITAPPSNVENGLGIFTGVSSDTLFFEVKEE